MKKSVSSILLVAVMVLMVSLTGCNSKSTPTPTTSKANEKVTFRLNYYASGLHAPFYVALSKGYYSEQGLDVTIGEGTGSGTTAKLIGNQSDTFGFVDAATSASAITQGIPIRIVSPIYAVNAFAVIALENSGIKSPQDLVGKKVGITTGDAPSKLFDGIANANNIDKSKITFVSMDSAAKVSALANKQVDAILGGADAQALQLKNLKLDITVLRYSDYGVPTIGLSIITSNNILNSNPELVKKFIAASLKGWDYARNHQDEAITIQQKYIPTMKADQAKQELEVALSCLFTKDSTSLGKLSDKDWKNTVELLQKYMGVDKTFPVDSFYSNSSLPEQLPSK